MKPIIILSFVLFFALSPVANAKSKKSQTREKNTVTTENKKSEVVTINVKEEKTALGQLKIEFSNFSHEHVSSGPGQPFSASVGVYFLKFSEGAKILEKTFYTSVEGESNPEAIFERFEVKMLKASNHQQTITLSVTHLKN